MTNLYRFNSNRFNLNSFNITKIFLFLNTIIFISTALSPTSFYIVLDLISSKHFVQKFIGNIIGAFCHTNILHFISNMVSFYNLRNLEIIMKKDYVALLLISIILNSLLLSIFNIYGVGFSAVLFALEIYYSKFSPIDFFMNKPMDRRLIAFIRMTIIYLLNSRSSLFGHFIGIMVGLGILKLEKLIY